MTSRSSYLPRLSLSRADEPSLPFHNHNGAHPDEYHLQNLSSPRESQHGLMYDVSWPSRGQHQYSRGSSPSARYSDKPGVAGYDSSMGQPAIFSRPPPPIATSVLLYNDAKDRDAGSGYAVRDSGNASFARNALSSVSSVLFDRRSPSRGGDDMQTYEPDTLWRSLQRRQKALQVELQRLLDAQSAALVANLDPSPPTPSSTRSDVSGTLGSRSSSRSAYSYGLHEGKPHTRNDYGHAPTSLEPTRRTASAAVVPVRQPRRRPMGLVAARTGLRRGMAELAELKAEEDRGLAAALGARQAALAQLRRLTGRQMGIKSELQDLERKDADPLARELRDLEERQGQVSAEITELKERLAELQRRSRWIDGQIEDVRNRRDAGLSGYQGALREVETRVSGLLSRPPVKPLDLEALGHLAGPTDGAGTDDPTPGGVEFMSLRPERRTPEMAADWWESEVLILESRKKEVDKERNALEEGARVWEEAVGLVSDFESGLRREMDGNVNPTDKGKQTPPDPEEAMRVQLKRMAEVIARLEQLLQIADDRGWNLLMCAIGAELAAFKEAELMLQGALRAAGSASDDDDNLTPRLGRSTSLKAPAKGSATGDDGNLVGPDEEKAVGSESEEPQGLLADLSLDGGDTRTPLPGSEADSSHCHEGDSEDEVPPEFLAQHHDVSTAAIDGLDGQRDPTG